MKDKTFNTTPNNKFTNKSSTNFSSLYFFDIFIVFHFNNSMIKKDG